MPDVLSESNVKERLTTRIIGADYRHLSLTHSTQDDVSEAGRAGAVEGLTITADEQTRGRGRFRRSWMSPPGASLLGSILLRPGTELLPSLSMIAALAVPRAIRRVCPTLNPEIKWPNDVLIGGRKVCGILVEVVWGEAEADQFAVAGIGINVNWDTASIPEIAETSTSLSRETGGEVSRLDLLCALLEEMEALYVEAREGGDVFGQWRAALITVGRRVNVSGSDSTFEGIALDVEPSGALVVQDDDGQRRVVHAGDVTLG